MMHNLFRKSLRNVLNKLGHMYLSPLAGKEVCCCKVEKCEENEGEPWSYSGGNGPSYWGQNYSNCNGMNQSPINIVEHETYKDNSLKEIQFNNYEVPISEAFVLNNGHTVQITPNDDVERSIGSLSTGSLYTLLQCHFHWGSCSKCGSEHLLNGKACSMEMHMVHRNGTNIAVVALCFKATHKQNPDLEPLVEILSSILNKDEQTSLQSPLHLDRLLPKKRNYYRYTGSLTTPGCDEGVRWTVFPDCLSIGTKQINEFRSLFSTPKDAKEHCHLVNNFRPVQDLNGRHVTFYWKRRG